jgi:hypothetical protein
MTEPRRVFIRAASVAISTELASGVRGVLTSDPDVDLGAVAKRVLGQRLRQASHFIELAAIGARLCVQSVDRALPPDTAIYVGTGLGELRKNEALFHQVFPPGAGSAAPFDFINATANMAAFYVARALGISARNLTVNQGLASFETALQLAHDDLRAGAVRTALVGGVDENCFPRVDYARRWPLRDGDVMGEGSAWLILSDDPQDALAELCFVKRLRCGSGELAAAVAAVSAQADRIVRGTRLSDAEAGDLVRCFPGAQVVGYVEYCGQYPTASGFGMASQLQGAPERGTWLHVNRTADDTAMLIGWRV